jgi:hypothetical protein
VGRFDTDTTKSVFAPFAHFVAKTSVEISSPVNR